jgi:indolepyruvate ferredoxin oxidoreductase, alpha subunit
MAERSFTKEVEALRLGAGGEFEGEAILAVTKALLQAGVGYVGGYQGAPVSHLMDVLADAQDILGELGVRFEPSASEATAAAMLAASVNYPIRGAVTWKSTVGTNVASDALANLASAGVRGGAVIVVGEDYGEGASIMQERTHAFAMKSQIWLLDPKPNLPSIVEMVQTAFELSEASNTPVMLMLRIRACHVVGRFKTSDNRRPGFTFKDALEHPSRTYDRIILPPSTYAQEKEKIEKRWPAAEKFIRERALNELIDGEIGKVGIVLQGGLYNTVLRGLERLGLADVFGASRVPLYVLNVTYPLVPEEVRRFATGKEAILVIEEGQPEFIEQNIAQILRHADLQTKLRGKGPLPKAGEYTGAAVKLGLEKFLREFAPEVLAAETGGRAPANEMPLVPAAELGKAIAPRPPGLCTGCPERPLFASLKLLAREVGALQVSADIGCHSFGTLPPFNIGGTIMGYGLGPASGSAFNVGYSRRPIALMGDGGFWHNGLTSGIANSVFNKHDGLTIIVDNGYSAATGGQYIPSSAAEVERRVTRNPIEKAVRGVGIEWVKTVHTYDMRGTMATLREALTTSDPSPKVVIAEGECQLNRQRRVAPERARQEAQGQRVVKHKFGVDAALCTGDRSCIRLSGCPSLTVKDNPDPLRLDPVTVVDSSCVGCGVCGEVAHAATLCPSFYRSEIVANPSRWDRWLDRLRRTVIGLMARRAAANGVLGA